MGPNRRAVLAAGLLAGLAGCGSRPRRAKHNLVKNNLGMASRHRYGCDPSQWADLYRPAGASRGTVVVIHGGFWRAEYGAELGAPLARDLARHGYTAWNVEYRRVGNGGGWPATGDDVTDALNLLGTLDVDLRHLITLGHSAGGQLATWAGHPGTSGQRVTGVISQAGVLDLVAAATRHVGGNAVPDFLGGPPTLVPGRYRAADPRQQLPLSIPVRCLHARADGNVPYWQSQDYVAAARAAGADATLTTVAGDHFSLIDVTAPAWQAALAALADLAG